MKTRICLLVFCTLVAAAVLQAQPARTSVTSLASGRDYKSLVGQANSLYQGKDYQKSVVVFEEAFKIEAGNAKDFYDGACAAALAGKPDVAFEWLRKTVDLGAAMPKHLEADADLISLHDRPQWPAIVAGMQKNQDARGAKIDRPLQVELHAVFEEDQKYRLQIGDIEKTYGRDSPQMRDLWKTIGQKDAENQAKVKPILDQRGWLGPDVVGNEGNMALFLVIQHADLKTQEKYLPMLRAAVKEKKAHPQSLALLEDRVALGEGRHQTYGSQLQVINGKAHLRPLDDPDNVDSRRAAVGLQPLSEYLKQWGLTWDVAEYKKQLPDLEKLEHPGN